MDSTGARCPYCREAVSGGARRCKHCFSEIEHLDRPDHDGVCPLCREHVHPEASMCKHCKEWIGATREIRLFALDSGGCGKRASGGVGITLGLASDGSAMMLRRPGFGSFGGMGGLVVQCACTRDCIIKDGVTTCGPWKCIGPPGCLDLPK